MSSKMPAAVPQQPTVVKSPKKRRWCQCRIPAMSIFAVCALFCAMVAIGSALGMYFFTIGIIDDSVKREGLTQANSIGAQVSAMFNSVEKTRNVTIGVIFSRRDEMVGMNAPALRTYLNTTFAAEFLSEAASNRVQGVEVACLLPEGITENYEATGFARVSVFYEILRNGNRRFTRSLTEDDGTSIRDVFVNFENSSSGSDLQLQVSRQGVEVSHETTNDTFVNSYQGDYAESDYFYFDGYAGPDGFAYFYATSYRYFFAGNRLCEVSVYQLVDSWFTIIADALRESSDTQLAIVDGSTNYVVASSFQEEYTRLSNCYTDYYEFEADGTCILKDYTELPTKLLRELIGAVYQDSWAVLDEEVPTEVSKRKVGGEEYYLVVKQLGNINYLRPILVWGRPVESVISDLRQTAIIIVVCSAVGIMLAMLLVAGCTAIWLLRPMKKLEEKMQRLTRMDTGTSEGYGDEEDYEDMTEFTVTAAGTPVNLADTGSTSNGDNPSITITNAMPHNHSSQQNKRRGNSVIREVDSLQYHFKAMGKALHSFSKYVPKDIVAELISSGQVATSGMRERRLTLMFVDIQGFTTMCEELSSAAVVSELLTLFFSANTKRLQAHGATIDKFIGDCIMCFWGAPLRVDNPNFRAICAGLDLQRTARELNDTFMNYGVALSVRVGCHTGRALVGNIGSDDRINYTAMGDVVNSTSRLEGINKQFFTAFLVSEAVLAGCKRQNLFVTRYVGDVNLRGKQIKLASHQVCGMAYRTMDEMEDADEGEEGTKVTAVRAGTLSLATGYQSVAAHCYIGEKVATACDLFSRCTTDEHTLMEDRRTCTLRLGSVSNAGTSSLPSFRPLSSSSPSGSDRPESVVCNPLAIPVRSSRDVSKSPSRSTSRRLVSSCLKQLDLKGGDLLGLDRQLESILGPAMYMPCCRADGTVISDPKDDSEFLSMHHDNHQEKAVLVSLRKDLKRRIIGKAATTDDSNFSFYPTS